MLDPGLDRHLWEARWQDLEPLVEESPREALPELARLVGELLGAHGLPADNEGIVRAEPVPDTDAAEPELAVMYRKAHRVARLLDAGEEVSNGDVASAVNDLRELYDRLLGEGHEP
jgi:hypothetical protein